MLDDRKVYSVAGFNRGVADWLTRLPTLSIEGEVTELRRHDRWGSVFFTLKDPADGSCVPASIARADVRRAAARSRRRRTSPRVRPAGALRGERRVPAARALARALWHRRRSRPIERLKQTLAAEGLFDAARKRRLPLLPRRIGARHR